MFIVTCILYTFDYVHWNVEYCKKQQQQRLSLKTISVHDYSELSEIEKTLLQERSTILIVRITPVALKDPEELAKFANQLYLIATKNNYSVFRLGEERIIVIPSCINVEK